MKKLLMMATAMMLLATPAMAANDVDSFKLEATLACQKITSLESTDLTPILAIASAINKEARNRPYTNETNALVRWVNVVFSVNEGRGGQPSRSLKVDVIYGTGGDDFRMSCASGFIR